MPADLKEFDDLIAALEDERPQIDPGFARELDNRAAAGFAKPRRRLRLPRIPMMVGAPAAAFAVVIALVVAAGQLSGGMGGEDAVTSTGAGGSVAAAPEPQVAQEESASAGKAYDDQTGGEAIVEDLRAAPDAAGTAPSSGPNRVQEQSASLTLAAPAKEISTVGDEILSTTDELGGFVVSSSVRATDGDGGGGDFQLRLPADRLDEGIARLSRIAHVRERSQGVLDITSERNVARDSLQEARAERVSLLDRLAAATTQTEVDALQRQIDNINVAIGRYRADLTRVMRRANFALVSVTLVAAGKNEAVGPVDDKWTPGDALRDAGRVLEVAAGVLVILGAVLIPLALLAAAVVATRRVMGRRGRERMLDAV